MVSKLIYWYFLCNSVVKQLLRLSVWLPHHLDPGVTSKKMWTAKSLCNAQIRLLPLKEGRLGSCMFQKTQQFCIGILNCCTIRMPRNRVKFQVSFCGALGVSDRNQYSDNIIYFRIYRAKLSILQPSLIMNSRWLSRWRGRQQEVAGEAAFQNELSVSDSSKLGRNIKFFSNSTSDNTAW